MSRLAKIVALLLLALWLPATMHCALESAHVIPSSPVCTDGADDHCTGDNCSQLEEGLFKQRTDELKVMSPQLLVGAFLLCLYLPPTAIGCEPFVRPPDQPQDWVTTWHFVRRAAPPSRAPSLLSA